MRLRIQAAKCSAQGAAHRSGLVFTEKCQISPSVILLWLDLATKLQLYVSHVLSLGIPLASWGISE